MLGVGTIGQPAKGNAWGDSGNKIPWQRARAGPACTDVFPMTNTVVTRCFYISVSSTRGTASLRCAKLRPSFGTSECPPLLACLRQLWATQHTRVTEFSCSVVLPVGICELSVEDQGESTELRMARSRCPCGWSPHPPPPQSCPVSYPGSLGASSFPLVSISA